MPRILYPHSLLSFGKHKGKSVEQVFLGPRPIPQADLAEMYFLYRDRPLGDGTNEHKVHSVFGKEDWNKDIPDGQRLLFHYQPHPSYIDWLVQHTEDWFLDPAELEALQSKKISWLGKIEGPSEQSGYLFTPIFNHTSHSFQYLTFKRAAEKLMQWNDSQDAFQEPDIDPLEDTTVSYVRNLCPACEEPMPCGCSYYNDQL